MAPALGSIAVWDWWIESLPDLVWPAMGLGQFDPRGARAREWRGLAELEHALRDRPRAALRDASRLALRGRLRRIMGLEGAGEDLDLSLRRDGDCSQAKTWRAETCLHSDPQLSLRLLAGLQGFAPSLYRGAALFRLRRYRQAAESFQLSARAPAAHAGLAWLLKAAAHLRLGEPQEAVLSLERSSRQGANCAALHWLKAYARHASGEPASARRSVEAALNLFPELTLEPFLGRALERENRPGETASAKTLSLLRSARRGPYRVWAAVQSAEDLRSPAFSRYRQAAELLRQAAREAKDSAWVHAYLGRGLESIGDSAGARRALDRAVRLKPRCAWIRAWRGQWLMRHGDAGALGELRKTASECPDYPFARAWLGGALRRAGRLSSAAGELETAIRMEPGYEWSHAELFQVRRQQKRWDEAARQVTEAFERDRKFVWAKRGDPESLREALRELDTAVKTRPARPLLQAWRAWVLLGLGAWREARQVLASLRGEKTAFFHFVRSEYWQSQGRLDRSQRSLSRAVALRRAPVYLGARGVELYRMGRLRGARAHLEESAASDGTSARDLCVLGAVLVELKRPERAVEALDKALGLDPHYAEALAHRAAASLVRGRPKAARRDLSRARGIRADCPWSALVAARLAPSPLSACRELLAAVERGAELPPRILQRARLDLKASALKARRLLQASGSPMGGATPQRRRFVPPTG